MRALMTLPDDVFLEGGDVIPFSREGRRTLLVGFGPRTSEVAARFLQGSLIPAHVDEIVAVQLSDWRMNLDGGFLPVAGDVVLIEPTSFRRAVVLDDRGQRPLDFLALLKDLKYRLIEISKEDSIRRQSANAVCLGDRTVIYYDLTPEIVARMQRCDITPLVVPGGELVKGRGGPRCMTRPLYGSISFAATA
jgi:N-dimethylarginine dimethylaminohydrolase